MSEAQAFDVDICWQPWKPPGCCCHPHPPIISPASPASSPRSWRWNPLAAAPPGGWLPEFFNVLFGTRWLGECNDNLVIYGFPEIGVPPNCPCLLDFPLQTIHLGVYPYFRKPPYDGIWTEYEFRFLLQIASGKQTWHALLVLVWGFPWGQRQPLRTGWHGGFSIARFDSQRLDRGGAEMRRHSDLWTFARCINEGASGAWDANIKWHQQIKTRNDWVSGFQTDWMNEWRDVGKERNGKNEGSNQPMNEAINQYERVTKWGNHRKK